MLFLFSQLHRTESCWAVKYDIVVEENDEKICVHIQFTAFSYELIQENCKLRGQPGPLNGEFRVSLNYLQDTVLKKMFTSFQGHYDFL